MCWGARKTLTGGQRAIQRRQAAAGVQEVGLFRDLSKQGATFFTIRQR